MSNPSPIRLALPSSGRLEPLALEFLSQAGLPVFKPNPRQYQAAIPALPGLNVIFQRAGDIVVSVRQGSVAFGITGLDAVEEKQGEDGEVLVLHDRLGFGQCALKLAVPESWSDVVDLSSLRCKAKQLGHPLRVATKFPVLTGRFLQSHGIPHTLIAAEGTLEAAPNIGYADLIADLVSSGQTLQDNRLRPLVDGEILRSEAALIANRKALKENPAVLEMGRQLLEYIEAHLRAKENLLVIANVRGEGPEQIAQAMFTKRVISGLQGPTIAPVVVRNKAQSWYSVTIVVRRDQLSQAIAELRSIGGSGIIVTPVTYIFEEEPPRYKAMLAALR
ncbi:MAG: ATP phosphoribosyltransferase [Anaerolineales bacterium]|nr:ATP phosphoribosyltransferase [Anaerolineales bacterium]MCS7248476.1 ATP phosphoribosyltransferase [Anaerolineales bacterium]MDW8162289.1 ATP phosphoribosyltransferase [Anaerolineales bacterium]MDW8447318.1 ATP phosphoribosyltransferase [Anaerolineales bacterium]